MARRRSAIGDRDDRKSSAREPWCSQAFLFARLAAQEPAESSASDSAFLLTTDDPARSPSPFIGNGHLGTVIPPLGIGAALSYPAGVYEHGPSDVPRIVAMPAWNAINIFDGERWLDAKPPADGSIQAYRQVVDMRTGTARTGYDWVHGNKSTSVRVETFVSRADPHLAAIRLEVTPEHRARMRVRFAMAGWPPPRRLALAKLTRAEPDWGPADVWYPGRMVVRSRNAAQVPGGARITMTSSPVGRTSSLAQAAAVSWQADLPGATAHTTAAGDTALVEIAFDGSPGQTYTFSEIVSFVSSTEVAPPMAARGPKRRAGTVPRLRQPGPRQRRMRGAAAGRPTSRSRAIPSSSVPSDRCCSTCFAARTGAPARHSPMGLSSAGYYGHIFWDSDTWMFPSLLLTHPDVAHSLVAFRGRTPAPAARANARANGYPGRDVSLGGRRAR